MEELKSCKVCDGSSMEVYLKVKDHFLSGEEFNIVRCRSCGFLFTNPRPEAANLGKYYKSENYISHSNSRKGILNKVYHLIRRHNHKKKFNLISGLVNKGEILDIGCATGEFLNYFKERGWGISGVEPDADARSYAKANYNIDVWPEEEIDRLTPGTFDIISLWHVLEHVPALNERMIAIEELLKDEGYAVIALPNVASYDAAWYGEFWAGYDVPRHLYHFSRETAEKLFSKHGFQLVKIEPMKFDAYYVSLLSEKYKNKRKSLFKAMNRGCKSNQWAKRHQNDYSSLIFVLKKKKTEL
jgi:2-polyprenyl-3-methyl-5-hydroxy-6-metoxy-1,4-benzoquinol methylase